MPMQFATPMALSSPSPGLSVPRQPLTLPKMGTKFSAHLAIAYRHGSQSTGVETVGVKVTVPPPPGPLVKKMAPPGPPGGQFPWTLST